MSLCGVSNILTTGNWGVVRINMGYMEEGLATAAFTFIGKGICVSGDGRAYTPPGDMTF